MNRHAEGETKKQLRLNPRVIERIEELHKAGTKRGLLADKAESIIARLKSGEGWPAGRPFAPCTQHGEKRIRKCIQYDLGWGHRLVTLLRGDILFICCLVTHDECDRWIEKNSRAKKFETPNARVCGVAPKAPEIQSSDERAHIEAAESK